ncbi:MULTISPECIES: DUF6884 domain-containing protein [Cupriavidus]
MLSRVDPLAPYARWRDRALAQAWGAQSAREAVLGALQCRRTAILHAQRMRAAATPEAAQYYLEELRRLRALARADLRRARTLRAHPVRQPYLLIACSATKRDAVDPLPALTRYDGPAYRVLRAGLPALAHRLPLRILSARYGLLAAQSPIPDYNQRMDAARAATIVREGAVAREIAADLARVRPTDILVMGGGDYREVFVNALTRAGLPAHVRVLAVQGGIGEQLGQLRRWLHNAPVVGAADVGARLQPHLPAGSAEAAACR